MQKKGFTLVEILCGLLIIGLAVGGAVEIVKAVRAHETATAAYSQEVTLEQYGADSVAMGDLVTTANGNVTGATVFPELGAADSNLETSIIATTDTGYGMVDELVVLEGADGVISVGSVSRMPSGRTTPGLPGLSPVVNISRSAASVNVGDSYTITWSSSDMENGVMVREILADGTWSEVSRNGSGSQSYTKSSAGVVTYEILGWVRGVKYSKQVQVDVGSTSYPPGHIEIDATFRLANWNWRPAAWETDTVTFRVSWSNMANVTYNGNTYNQRNGSATFTASWWDGFVDYIFQGRPDLVSWMVGQWGQSWVDESKNITGKDLNGDSLSASVKYRVLDNVTTGGGGGGDDDDDGNPPPPDSNPSVWVRSQTSVALGSTYEVEWGSSEVASVSITGPSLNSTARSSSKVINATSLGEKTYTIKSTDGTNKTATWKVNVYDPMGSAPWVSIGASKTQVTVGEQYTVGWSSGNCTSVAVSGGFTSTSKNGSHVHSAGAVGTVTHKIVGQPGNVTKTVQVEVVPPSGGATVQIWANKTSVVEGEDFTVFWRAVGCIPTLVARKPEPFQDKTPVFWTDGIRPATGDWKSSGTENDGDWPNGVYVFGISGNGAESQYVRVTLTPYPEQSLPARKYDQSGVTLVGGAFYHVISQMVGDGSSWTDNKKVRKENMTYRFTDWWYPYLSTLKSGFDGQVDDQNNAKHVAEVLEQKVRAYTELHRADFETIFRQPDGTIPSGKPYTAEELKTTIYYSAGQINGMATIEWGPAFKSGPRLYWGGNTYETTWHDWPVTKFSVWRD